MSFVRDIDSQSQLQSTAEPLSAYHVNVPITPWNLSLDDIEEVGVN
jgi:hypothetical protein